MAAEARGKVTVSNERTGNQVAAGWVTGRKPRSSNVLLN